MRHVGNLCKVDASFWRLFPVRFGDTAPDFLGINLLRIFSLRKKKTGAVYEKHDVDDDDYDE